MKDAPHRQTFSVRSKLGHVSRSPVPEPPPRLPGLREALLPWGIFFAYWAVFAVGSAAQQGGAWPAVVAIAVVDALSWMGVALAVLWVAFHVPGGARGLAITVAAALLLIALRLGALDLIGLALPDWFIPAGVAVQLVPSHLVFTSGIAAAGFAVRAQLAYAERERRLARLRMAVADEELRALRLHVQPDFVFRVFGRIARLMEPSPAAADRLLVRLSTYMRRILVRSRRSRVSAADEVETLRRYARLEEMGRSESFRLRVEHDAPVPRTLVPFHLLPSVAHRLVEHLGGEEARGGVLVRVLARAGMLSLRIAVRSASAGTFAWPEIAADLQAFVRGSFGLEALVAARRSPGGRAARVWMKVRLASAAHGAQDTGSPPQRLSHEAIAIAGAGAGMRGPVAATRWWAGYVASWVGAWLLWAACTRAGMLMMRIPWSTASAAGSAAKLTGVLMLGGIAAVCAGFRLGAAPPVRLGRLPALLGSTMVLTLAAAAAYTIGSAYLGSSVPVPVAILLYGPTIFMVFVGLHGVGWAMAFARRTRVLEARAMELQAHLSEAQARGLKMQLHPHFLFNALNSVLALIRADVPRARTMLRQIEALLEESIRTRTAQLVPVAEELAFVSLYLEIESTRYSDRLHASVGADTATGGLLVPHMVLQPLVENAIRHGLAPLERPVRVSVRAWSAEDGWLTLEVSDDGCGLRPGWSAATDGVGLSNTRARLERIYGSRFELALLPGSPTGLMVRIRVPAQAADPPGRAQRARTRSGHPLPDEPQR